MDAKVAEKESIQKVSYKNNKLDMPAQEGETPRERMIRENAWIGGDVINQAIDLLTVFPNKNAMSFTNASAVDFETLSTEADLKNTNLFFIHATTDDGFNPNDLDALFEHVDKSKKNTFVITTKVGPHFETYLCNTNGEILFLKTDKSKDHEKTLGDIHKVMRKHDIDPIDAKTIYKQEKTGADSGAVVIANALSVDPTLSLSDPEQEKKLTYSMLAIINEKQAHLRELLYHLMRNQPMQNCWNNYQNPENQPLLYSPEEVHRENFEGVKKESDAYLGAFNKFIADYQPPEAEQLAGKIELKLSDEEFHRIVKSFCEMQKYEYTKNGEASANIKTNLITIRADKTGDDILFTAEKIENGQDVAAIKEFAQYIGKVSGQHAKTELTGGTAFQRFQAYITCVKRGLYVECDTSDFSPIQIQTISKFKDDNETNKLKFEGKYKEEDEPEDENTNKKEDDVKSEGSKDLDVEEDEAEKTNEPAKIKIGSALG